MIEVNVVIHSQWLYHLGQRGCITQSNSSIFTKELFVYQNTTFSLISIYDNCLCFKRMSSCFSNINRIQTGHLHMVVIFSPTIPTKTASNLLTTSLGRGTVLYPVAPVSLIDRGHKWSVFEPNPTGYVNKTVSILFDHSSHPSRP